jgi:hypothetical protein
LSLKTLYLIAALSCCGLSWWLTRREKISLNQTLGQIYQEHRRRGIRRHPLVAVLTLAGVIFICLHMWATIQGE